MKRILIPTDFSEQANNAIRVGVNLAKKLNAEVILLHILDLPQENGDALNKGTSSNEIIFFKNAADAKLTSISHDPIFEGLTVLTSLILDRTASGVVTSAENNNVDLIVMGSHGASGMKEYFVGSNTEKVVRTSSIPVFVVKGDSDNVNFEKTIFASDFSDSITPIFTQTLEFIKVLYSTVHPLMINTPNNFKPTHVAKEIFTKFLKDGNFEDDYELNIYNDLDVEKGILNYAKEIDASLIIMATHGRKGIAHFLNGSIGEDLVNHSPLPVLTIRIEK